MALLLATGCVRFAMYCAKMYSEHLSWYSSKQCVMFLNKISRVGATETIPVNRVLSRG